ncbi:Hypothetical protein ORPV_838 [Orpheovirus IHUMI-LCC2]|uniref:SKP1/BTB/POZ domain-containing protein n=1 Tax=Orpheovirus IHUMI-LCC2 TaxID=2023057 RepID=A0A2I2L5C0_9VIRU|nr:Hypothetical protein ORPV_838 [Orpheovirus IHUMI-LCC2]SNW62742.1 Hypothetical protein ORPV_838 [Orpheovirus IHUMI-LCC2]
MHSIYYNNPKYSDYNIVGKDEDGNNEIFYVHKAILNSIRLFEDAFKSIIPNIDKSYNITNYDEFQFLKVMIAYYYGVYQIDSIEYDLDQLITLFELSLYYGCSYIIQGIVYNIKTVSQLNEFMRRIKKIYPNVKLSLPDTYIYDYRFNYRNMYNNPLYSDITLSIENLYLYLHKVILADINNISLDEIQYQYGKDTNIVTKPQRIFILKNIPDIMQRVKNIFDNINTISIDDYMYELNYLYRLLYERDDIGNVLLSKNLEGLLSGEIDTLDSQYSPNVIILGKNRDAIVDKLKNMIDYDNGLMLQGFYYYLLYPYSKNLSSITSFIKHNMYYLGINIINKRKDEYYQEYDNNDYKYNSYDNYDVDYNEGYEDLYDEQYYDEKYYDEKYYDEEYYDQEYVDEEYVDERIDDKKNELNARKVDINKMNNEIRNKIMLNTKFYNFRPSKIHYKDGDERIINDNVKYDKYETFYNDIYDLMDDVKGITFYNFMDVEKKTVYLEIEFIIQQFIFYINP